MPRPKDTDPMRCPLVVKRLHEGDVPWDKMPRNKVANPKPPPKINERKVFVGLK